MSKRLSILSWTPVAIAIFLLFSVQCHHHHHDGPADSGPADDPLDEAHLEESESDLQEVEEEREAHGDGFIGAAGGGGGGGGGGGFGGGGGGGGGK